MAGQTDRDKMDLKEVFEHFGNGAFVRPTFQRAFVWHAGLIRELIWSILHDYFTGSLLLWAALERDDSDPLRTYTGLDAKPLQGWPEDGWPEDGWSVGSGTLPDRPEWVKRAQAKPEWVVLDGQQRLTAIFYAFMPDISGAIFTDKHGRNEGEYEFYVQLDKFDHVNKLFTTKEAINFSQRLSRADKEAISKDIRGRKANDDPSPEWRTSMVKKGWPLWWWYYIKEHRFPLYLLSSNSSIITHFFDAYLDYWVQIENGLEIKSNQRNAGDDVLEKLTELTDQLTAACGLKSNENHARMQQNGAAGHLLKAQDYKLSYIELPYGTDVDRVRDVFMQLNTHGEQLTEFELYNAQIAVNGSNPRRLFADISKAAATATGMENIGRKNLEDCIFEMLLLECVHGTVEGNPHIKDESELQKIQKLQKALQEEDLNNLKWDPHLLPHVLPRPENKGTNAGGTGTRVTDGQLIRNFEDLERRFSQIESKLQNGLAGLAKTPLSYGVPPQATWEQLAPQRHMIPYFCVLFDTIKEGEESMRGDRFKCLEQWWWAWTLSGKYDALTRRQRWEDLTKMEEWIEQPTNPEKRPPGVKDFMQDFKDTDLEDAVAAWGDEQATPIFWAVLNFLYSKGPEDLTGGVAAGKSEHVIFKQQMIVPPEQVFGVVMKGEDGEISEDQRKAIQRIRSVFNYWYTSASTRAFIAQKPPTEPADWLERLEQRMKSPGTKIEDAVRTKAWKSHLITEDALRLLNGTPFTSSQMKTFIEQRTEEFLRELGHELKIDFGQPREAREIALAVADIEGKLREMICTIYAGSNRRHLSEAFKGVSRANGDREHPQSKAQELKRRNQQDSIKKDLEELMRWRGLKDIGTILTNPNGGAYGLLTTKQQGHETPMRRYSQDRALETLLGTLRGDLDRVAKVRNAVFHEGSRATLTLTKDDLQWGSLGLGRLRVWVDTYKRDERGDKND